MRFLIFQPMSSFSFQPMGIHQSLDPCESYKAELVFVLFVITMAKLHGFSRSMEPITEFDDGEEDVVPRQKT